MFKIKFSPQLKWEIKIWWSKNAALPIFAANFLLPESQRIFLQNAPQILDLHNLIKLGEIAQQSSKKYFDLTSDLASKIRSSILLIPVGLNLFGETHFYGAGWCKIGKRPLDAFDDALTQAGIQIKNKKDKKVYKRQTQPSSKIVLSEFSVTTTEALLIYLTFLKGAPEQITIYNVATEPHVVNLIEFLNFLWWKIKLHPNHKITIRPVAKPKPMGEKFNIIWDYLEAWTYFALGALSPESEIILSWLNVEDLLSFLKKSQQVGIDFNILDDNTIKVSSKNLKNYKPTKIQTMIFPGFPTDLQPIFATILTQVNWISKIHETLFEGRFNYLYQLENLGANFEILNPHQVIIIGKTKLKWNYISSTDIRWGGAMLVAWVIAQWETNILNEDIILRWYEKVEEKLKTIGVNISRL